MKRVMPNKVTTSIFVFLFLISQTIMARTAEDNSGITANEIFDLTPQKDVEGTTYEVDEAAHQLVRNIWKAEIKGDPLIFPNRSPRAQWFPTAGFGLFIHWGIYAVEGRNPSWSMRSSDDVERREANIKGYYAAAKKFDPQKFDPDKWMAAAKKAGFTYAVLTTKHHDGYALWPSQYGFGTRTHMNGRDLIAPYVEACRRHGLKVGFYFSPRDWHYPGFAGFAGTEPMFYDIYIRGGKVPELDPEENQAAFDEFYAYSIAQLEELLTWYGDIDQMWFDGVRWPDVEIYTSATLRWMRSLQPGMVISNNWDDRVPPVMGDYRYIRPPHPSKEITWWEAPYRWKGNWGWSPDAPMKSTAWVLQTLVEVRSKGGNLLLNMGPSPEGEMPEEFYAACEELAGWMIHSGESVIGTWPGPEQDCSNVPITRRYKKWYLHSLPEDVESVEHDPRDKEITVADIEEPRSVRLLRTNEDLDYEYEGNNLNVVIPAEKQTRYVDVIVLRW